MKLVTVIPGMNVGGAEVVAASLSVAAHRAGHDVLLASAPGFRVAGVTAAGVAHVPIPLDSRRPGDLARSVLRLRRALGRSAPDLVHAHNPKAALAARLAFGRAAPIVTTLHGVPAGELATAVRILRWASDRVVAVSPFVADQLAEHGYPTGRTDVVENAIEPLPSYPRDVARDELGVGADEVVGLCLARLVDQKRHDLLVQAWAGLPQHALLLVVGEGATRPRIEDAVTRLGLGDTVRLLGERTDVARLLAAADLLVLPTDWEGLPISLLEAMGAGVPVVVSRVGGVIETLGTALRLVEPGSVDSLAAAIGELVGDEELRAELGRRGRTLVADRFAPHRMQAGYHELYDTLVGQRHRAPLRTGVRS
ncbi:MULTISPECIES: glycosyltransferase [Nocardioides]|uniref:Glycosyltransferase n=1 Tax=Nocardioides vastitatis TaxID=2568655 RepID=A0ABW0ZBV4_9ACTN|nr:glycosyltransferase [Nocardioides sp.]THI98871.1 glycosyltransferase [Nocardioides sp.]